MAKVQVAQDLRDLLCPIPGHAGAGQSLPPQQDPPAQGPQAEAADRHAGGQPHPRHRGDGPSAEAARVTVLIFVFLY